jgi:transglutaminase-like putative cysteine protease
MAKRNEIKIGKLRVSTSLILVILAVIFILFIVNKNSGEQVNRQIESTKEWQAEYITIADEVIPFYDSYTANTDYYDYNNPIIADAADKILNNSVSERDAIEQTLAYVFDNVQYVFESNDACFKGEAPKILESGAGQCDTQSMVVIAMLRRMGIAAVPAGGCIIVGSSLQSVYLQALQASGEAPKYEEIVYVDPTLDTFSRGPDPNDESLSSRGQAPKGSFGRTGGLHAWVMAWSSEEGWLTLESTTGTIANTDNFVYHVEIFPDNNDKNAICVSQSLSYLQSCRIDDLSGLNDNGVGVVGEVNPNE